MMNLFRKLTVVFLALLVTLPIAAVNATPIAYSLTLEVNDVNDISDPVYQVGNRYFGFFVIDDAILQNDGLNKAGDLLQFEIVIEDYFWSMNLPYPQSDFHGFYGPGVDFPASSPGFDVQNGEIVNLRGGVFGASDVPYVDFACLLANDQCIGNAQDNSFTANVLGFGRSRGFFGGSLNVARIQVSEPGTLVLLGLGLVGMCMTRRKKKL